MHPIFLDFRRSTVSDSRRFASSLSVGSVLVLLVMELLASQPTPANPPPQPQNSEPIPASALAQRRPETPQAFVPRPSERQIPTPSTFQSIEQVEDALIQQMSGNAAVAPAARTTASSPVFTPPSPAQTFSGREGGIPALPPNPTGAIAEPPLLVTTGSNSDVGLGLLAPRQQECLGTSCDRLQPSTAQRGTLTPTIPTLPPSNSSPSGNFAAPALTPSIGNPSAQFPTIDPPAAVPSQQEPLQRSTALNEPSLQLQGVYLLQGDDSSARARLAAVYPLTPRVLAGATLDLTDGTAFDDSRGQGLQLNELYLATSLQDLPNLRFVIGQIDLTSYFDRNSFAKDGATHFFNPVFQTNPALSATGIAPRTGALVNWTLTDNIEAKAAVYSSARNIGGFTLDGFAGEVGIRYGNAIIRGTYAASRDAGLNDGFQGIFQLPRGDDRFGILESDREESYGVNAEVFVPNLNLGLFGRYGRYENQALGLGGDTFNFGVSFLDLFTPEDRLGIAYGRALSNEQLRQQAGIERPDVLEVFYDFRFLSNLRLGFSVQQRNDFSETVLGVRVKTEFDVTPTNREFR
ncbi:MAG: hypothetical protein KME06_09845 [Kastovskya adunca ATA6-11-RM4]|nr:hypothetical protein [Kastovskya adunca ATA6-11-RM4]